MLRRFIWSPVLALLVSCTSLGNPFYSPLAHIKQLVNSDKTIEASEVYELSKNTIEDSRKKTIETLDLLARHLADYFAEDIEKALVKLEILSWPQPTDRWKSTRATLDSLGKTVDMISTHSLLAYKYPSITKLSVLKEELRETADIIRSGMYIAFLSYPLDSPENFFDLYPVRTDRKQFLVKHQSTVFDKLETLKSSGYITFVEKYKSDLELSMQEKLSRCILSKRIGELSADGTPIGLCTVVTLLDLRDKEWILENGCTDTIGVCAFSNSKIEKAFSIVIETDVPYVNYVSVSEDSIPTKQSAEDYDILIVCDTGSIWSETKLLSEEIIESEFVSGNRVEINPEYTDAKFNADEASMELQQVQIKASSRQKTKSPLYNLGFAIGHKIRLDEARGKYDMAMEVLRNTPMTLNIPVYSRYTYTSPELKITKNVIASVYLIDFVSGLIHWNIMELSDSSDFTITKGLHDQDRNIDKISSLIDNQADIDNYIHSDYNLTLSTLLKLALKDVKKIEYNDTILSSLFNKNRKEARSKQLLMTRTSAPAVLRKDRALDNSTAVLSVLDFEIRNMSAAEGQLVVDLITSALLKTNSFRMIDRGKRDSILKEIEFSYSDCTDVECQIEIGRFLSADKIVVGSLGRVGDRFLLTAKLLDVESGEMLSSAYKIFASINELVDDCERLSFELVDIN